MSRSWEPVSFVILAAALAQSVLAGCGGGADRRGGDASASDDAGSVDGSADDDSGAEAGEGGGPGAGGAGGGRAGEGGSGGTNRPRDAGIPDVSFIYQPTDAARDACAVVRAEPTDVSRPMDIIFIIDNSGSMGGEISQVQDRINGDFATIIGNSGIDYRVIMVSRYGEVGEDVNGSNNPICIGGSLGGANSCLDPHNTQLINNLTARPRFFHYSADIESLDSWCKLLEGYDTSDELLDNTNNPQRPFSWSPQAPNGWSRALRTGSFKVFVEITDDDVNCNQYGYDFDDRSGDDNDVTTAATEALNFDIALRALSPAHFGTAAERNYIWYSIVGMAAHPSGGAWPPSEPVQTARCTASDSDGPGKGYQALSILTGGLRYPTCDNDNFDAIFNAIAQGVIEQSAVPCEFDVPPPDEGIIDEEKVVVEYTPGDDGKVVSYDRVKNESKCAGDDGFYFDPAPTRIVLCPESCATVQADDDAQIDINLGCLGS